MKNYIKYTFVTIFFLFLILPQTTIFSQTSLKDTQKSFTINHFPQYPAPNETVNAKIISYSFNTDKAYITWTLDGKVVSQGRGQKNFEFTNGSLGDSMSLNVSIVTQDGLSTSETLNFKILDIDLLWETDSHTPVFYKGKAGIVEGAFVKITAVPQSFDNTKNLIYRWQRGFDYDSQASGVNKNTYLIKFNKLIDGLIIVTVSDQQGLQFHQKRIRIRTIEPEILFYEEEPLEGPIYQKAIFDKLELTGQSEIVIRAEPYFFSNNDFFDLLRNWKMNSKKIEPFSNPNFIGLTVPEGADGEASIELEVKNPNSYFQKANGKIKLLF